MELRRYRRFPWRSVSGTDAWSAENTQHAGGAGTATMMGAQFRRYPKTIAKKYSPNTLWKLSKKKDSVFNFKDGALIGHIGLQGQSGAVAQLQDATGSAGNAGDVKEADNPVYESSADAGQVLSPPSHQGILNPAYNAVIHWVRDSIVADTMAESAMTSAPKYDSYLDGCTVKVTLKQKVLFFDSRQMERVGCVPEDVGRPIYENCPQEYQPSNSNPFAISVGIGGGLLGQSPIPTAPVCVLSSD